MIPLYLFFFPLHLIFFVFVFYFYSFRRCIYCAFVLYCLNITIFVFIVFVATGFLYVDDSIEQNIFDHLS